MFLLRVCGQLMLSSTSLSVRGFVSGSCPEEDEEDMLSYLNGARTKSVTMML